MAARTLAPPHSGPRSPERLRAAKSLLLKQIPLVPTPERGRRRLQGLRLPKAAKRMRSRQHASSWEQRASTTKLGISSTRPGGGQEGTADPGGNACMGGDGRAAPIATSSSFQQKALAGGPNNADRAGRATPCHRSCLLGPEADRLVQLGGHPMEPPRDATALTRSSRARGAAYFQPNTDFQQHLTCSRKMSSSQVPESRRDRTFNLLQGRLEEETLQPA